MLAKMRFCAVMAAAGLTLASSAALGQSVPDAATNAPASTVGPPELRNFSLPGTVTRTTDQPAAPAATNQTSPARAAPSAERRTASSPPAGSAAPAAGAAERASPSKAQTRPPAPAADKAAPATVAPTFELTPPQPALSVTVPQAQTVAVAPQAVSPAGHQLAFLPWLATGLALLLGGGFLLFMRYRRREAYGGPEFDLLVAPEAVARPATPRLTTPTQTRAATPVTSPPAAPTPAPPTPRGIVSTRLRPSLEISVHPLRCHCDADKVILEFELELLNTGSVPARAVLAEASLLNAGETQDDQLSAFFTSPAVQGEALDSIPPLKSMKFISQVVAPRSAVQEYELAGRKVFVPVLAFNALYRWGSAQGQTSAAYLVGRQTNGDRLGPLRLDGARADFRNLAARPLPATLRT